MLSKPAITAVTRRLRRSARTFLLVRGVLQLDGKPGGAQAVDDPERDEREQGAWPGGGCVRRGHRRPAVGRVGVDNHTATATAAALSCPCRGARSALDAAEADAGAAEAQLHHAV